MKRERRRKRRGDEEHDHGIYTLRALVVTGW